MELFRPLKMPLKEYKKLVQDPDVRLRSMAPGETYAIEGVSVPDQLSLLVSGWYVSKFIQNQKLCFTKSLFCSVHVYVEGKFIHKIDEFSFLDSPEWESFSEEFPEHFQVRSSATQEFANPLTSYQKSDYARKFRDSSQDFYQGSRQDFNQKFYRDCHQGSSKILTETFNKILTKILPRLSNS